MRSRWFGWVLLLSCIGLVACVPRLGEKPVESKLEDFSDVGCLESAIPVIEDFFDGKAKDEKINESWGCLKLSFSKFIRYVQGSQKDRYTSQEISTFFENNFLEKNSSGKSIRTIHPALQVELMKFKQLFVGGSLEYVTKAELQKSIITFDQLNVLSLKINPYMELLSSNWKVHVDETQEEVRFFEEANKVFQDVAGELSSIVSNNKTEYKMKDFLVFMQEFSKFYGESWKIIETMETYLPVAMKIKKAVAGGNEAAVAAHEWKSFSILTSRSYVQYLRYYYFIRTKSEEGISVYLPVLARSIEDVFSIVHDLVKEKSTQKITRQEIEELALSVSQAWPEFKVNNQLVKCFMKLKRLFFGGSEESWVIQDIQKAPVKIKSMQLIIDNLLSYYSVYTTDWQPELLPPEKAQIWFDKAADNLDSISGIFANLTESSYSFEDLHDLIFEIENLYPSKINRVDEEKKSEIIQRYTPLVREFKNVLLNQSDSIIHNKDEWKKFLLIGSRSYSTYLYYTYFVKDFSRRTEDGSKSMIKFSLRGKQLLSKFLELKSQHEISNYEINRILVRLQVLDLLSSKIKPQTMLNFTNLLVGRVLNSPEDRIEKGIIPTAFDLNSLSILHSEIENWLLLEGFIAAQYVGRGENALPDLLQKIDQEVSGGQLNPFHKEAFLELRNLLNSPVPLNLDSKDRLLIYAGKASSYNENSLRQLNLTRWMSRLLVRSFSTNLLRVQSYAGLSIDEARDGFESLKPLLLDLNLLDTSNKQFLDSRFREANIFMPRSDGNELVSFLEAANLFTFILSGEKLNSNFKPSLFEACLPGVVEPGPDSIINYQCLKEEYRTHFNSLFSSMPKLVEYRKGLSDLEFSCFFYSSLKAAGYIPNSDWNIREGDASLFPHLIQYMEMLFERFDTNSNGEIDRQDAEVAFPSFKELFKQLAKKDLEKGRLKESDLFALFTYVLKNGKAPESTVEKLKFLVWKNRDPKHWKVHANRSFIAQILAYVAQTINKESGLLVDQSIEDQQLMQECGVLPAIEELQPQYEPGGD